MPKDEWRLATKRPRRSVDAPRYAKSPDAPNAVIQANAKAIRQQLGGDKRRMHEQRMRSERDKLVAKLETQIKHSKLTISQIQAKVARMEHEIASTTSGSPGPTSV